MEAAAGAKEESVILGTIRPPRLEDAGLEDCALSPNSIKAAFFKAADSLRSLVSNDEHHKTESKPCGQDPTPTPSEGDSLVGVSPAPDPPGPCGNEKGGGVPEIVGDEVSVAGDGEDDGFDQLLGPKLPLTDGGEFEEGGKKKSCVDGLQGLEIGDDKEKRRLEGEKEGKERPILAEAYI